MDVLLKPSAIIITIIYYYIEIKFRILIKSQKLKHSLKSSWVINSIINNINYHTQYDEKLKISKRILLIKY